MQEQMTQLLNELISTVKELSPQLWEILLRQVQLEGYTYLVWLVFVLILTCLAFGWAVYIFKKGKRLLALKKIDDFDNQAYVMGTIVLTIAGCFFLGLAFSMSMEAFKMLMNPEYYAIQILLEQLK